MTGFALISAVVLPLIFLVGGIATWRVIRKDQARNGPTTIRPAWRDDSLEDWRKQRDAAAEAEREARVAEARPGLTTGRAEEQEEAKRQQRIGG